MGFSGDVALGTSFILISFLLVGKLRSLHTAKGYEPYSAVVVRYNGFRLTINSTQNKTDILTSQYPASLLFFGIMFDESMLE